mgnify:CR=1 FL=1
MDEKSIKQRMRTAREKTHLSQVEMAERLDMSLRAYSDLEGGKTRIFNKRFQKFAETTGTPVEELAFGYVPGKAPLELQESFERTKNNLDGKIREYERLLDEEREKVSLRDRRIAELEDRLRDKEKLIRLLEKQLG